MSSRQLILVFHLSQADSISFAERNAYESKDCQYTVLREPLRGVVIDIAPAAAVVVDDTTLTISYSDNTIFSFRIKNRRNIDNFK